MGNSNSSEEDSFGKVGYRVLGVQPESPASRIGLVSFFDFIVAANGVPLSTLDNTFIELIKSSEDKPLPLRVYNCKSKSFRDLELIPSRNWPGEGMLGVTIRFDSYHNAQEELCHVTDVDPDSPAELAGLVAGSDYLLGTLEKVFKTPEILYDELRTHVNVPLDFYVYNTDSDEVRTCVVMPATDWGGEGLLGANVANGLLHALPSECCETPGRSSDGVFKATNSPFGMNAAPVSPGGEGVRFSAPDDAELPRPNNALPAPPHGKQPVAVSESDAVTTDTSEPPAVVAMVASSSAVAQES